MKPTPERRRPVTRGDVALHAGVSTAVVSYVVNAGPRNVAPATRERVLDAIRDLGYRPNAAARALKLGVSGIIGLVVSDNTNPFFADYARAVESEAAVIDLSVILTNSALSATLEHQLVQKLISRQVDGLLLASTEDDPDLASAREAHIPVVLLDRAGPEEGFSSVGVNFREASRLAVEHLILHGHRKIGIISGLTGGATTRDRELGWADALAAAGLPEGPMVRADFGRIGGYEAGRQLLSLPDRPTAIYSLSDMQAIGLLRSVHEAGVRVPEDLAVISFDGSAESEYSWPPLTAMRQPVADMAKAAIEALGHGVTGITNHQTFRAELVVRRSCGCDAPARELSE
ncbi:LacI family DNA-binding transcriptional regulator [Lacisediminihabitans profunda]|uniref:LacI family transcriptional regulator n=1 Tax=Lacisediminihabitans profunda TaxID=2594790 RepID=A0A5C8UUL4_9MICO|nr:LacI family DNA-binding transcriptional regulator [Lacisediminihabitans profunda]TXN32324.1 LacI family transcriptional regulator [Lacisediminihabitans profunda]